MDFDPEFVVSLGGDGTILYAARRWALNGSPILGVNLGTLGFLAEVEPNHYEEILKDSLEGKAILEERSCLLTKVYRDEVLVNSVPIINDAVINKGAFNRILNLRLSVDGSKSWSYRADGLIIATTTGSTAYNLSAGGPVVHPTMSAFVVTPICPFALSGRSLVLPLSSRIEVVVEESLPEVFLTADGQSSFKLKTNDRVVTQKSPYVVKLVKNPHREYLDTLQLKLGLFQKER
jgi:NAD+ kinase